VPASSYYLGRPKVIQKNTFKKKKKENPPSLVPVFCRINKSFALSFSLKKHRSNQQERKEQNDGGRQIRSGGDGDSEGKD
jgi:hypothetical protein